MKVVLLVVRCMIPARKLLHAQTVPKAVLIFRCITTLQKNTKIVSTHVKMASGVIPVPQSLVKDALKMLKYFAWQQNTVIITILQYTAILHMRSLGWTTTVSAVNVIWCFITKMKRSGEFCDHVFHHFGPSPRRVVSTGRRMNICLCVCFSTDVYLWWEASVRLGELSSGWCFWFWYRKGVARVHECSQVLFRLQLFTCSPPAVQSPELQIPPAGIFVSWLGSYIFTTWPTCAFPFHQVCMAGTAALSRMVFFAFHHTKLIAVSLSPMFLYGVTLLLSSISSGLHAAW